MRPLDGILADVEARIAAACAASGRKRDGVRIVATYEALKIPDYKGEYDWPSAVNFEDEEREENTAIFADLNTYFTENYGAFIDGSKPMSEWDSYVQGLYDFGLSDVTANYQAAYDRLQARDL